MDKPFELLRPFPRDDEHDELADALIERALEPQDSPTFCSDHKLRAAQQGHKRAFTPLRGPAIISSAALRCASVHFGAAAAAASAPGKRLSHGPFHFTHKRLPTLQ